jgi:AcrR family transcriptional regulator
MSATAEKVAKTPPRRRRADKRTQLLRAASRFFLKHGYDKGSINALARSSAISKESIYRYFNSKEQLFEAVIDKELEDYQTELAALVEGFEELSPVEGLTRTAEAMLTVLTSERTLAMRRLVFQAVGRNPDIGRHYYRIGPEYAYTNLENYFRTLPGRPGFKPAYLARAFVALVLHEIMLQRECGVLDPPSAAVVKRRARRAVEGFAAAYLES